MSEGTLTTAIVVIALLVMLGVIGWALLPYLQALQNLEVL